MLPDRDSPSVISATLVAAARRRQLAETMKAFSVAMPVGVLCWAMLGRIGTPAFWSAALASAIGGALSLIWLAKRRSRWSHAAAAQAIELAYPDIRNVVITAEELLRHPGRARPWIAGRVFESAARAVLQTNIWLVSPLRKEAGLLLLSVCLVAAVVFGWPQRALSTLRTSAGGDDVSTPRTTGEGAIEATVTPPAYVGQSPRTLQSPERIDALQGSQLLVTMRGGGPWRARFGTIPLAIRQQAGASVFDLPLEQSGYLAIEAGEGDATGRRRLIPIAVAPDRAPRIRISAPAKDLLLPNASQAIAVEASATDDFALQSLDLRYTKVSGTGEQFEFLEGSIPLSIARQSERAWNARAQIALPTLALAPGDSIIYRVVGRDRRPGDAGLAASDTYFVEIAGPGQVALEGFEMPPDRERYALSQQMIVLKLERLRARERSLDRVALEQEIGNIAAEQRAVRANFVFLTGGHVEDEEEEAEQSHEIQEGRLENTARREIAAAIQHMSRAEQGMAAVSTSAALPPARAAVEALQRAFGRNRYLLRTVPVRSRIDPSRRLSGEASSATDWRRELFPIRSDRPDMAARRILARLLEVSGDVRSGSIPPAALTAMAEESIAVDPASVEWQSISKNLLQLRDNLKGDASVRASALNETAAAIAAVVHRGALPALSVPRGDAALKNAWVEERRR